MVAGVGNALKTCEDGMVPVWRMHETCEDGMVPVWRMIEKCEDGMVPMWRMIEKCEDGMVPMWEMLREVEDWLWWMCGNGLSGVELCAMLGMGLCGVGNVGVWNGVVRVWEVGECGMGLGREMKKGNVWRVWEWGCAGVGNVWRVWEWGCAGVGNVWRVWEWGILRVWESVAMSVGMGLCGCGKSVASVGMGLCGCGKSVASVGMGCAGVGNVWRVWEWGCAGVGNVWRVWEWGCAGVGNVWHEDRLGLCEQCVASVRIGLWLCENEVEPVWAIPGVRTEL
ncbi:hypothetical protein HNY73_004200 [Argiope bruennichi]|uniref:Uncharacterized protein n=1 Tax=Argiope bruennichi TaxID=94029 RepID=A0A8T0FR22_ARGBR|nr:hypothetical protein HNY73_004200 [Argiope bruennichi]